MSSTNRTKPTRTLAVTAALLLVFSASAIAQSEPGSEIRFFNWAEYVDPQVLQDFEDEFGIKVIVETFEDENEMLSVIQADTSRYDVFTASGATLFEMAEQRLVAELDHDNIPNLANIDPKFLDVPNDPGNQFSVPYDWGTTGLAYNTDCIEPEEETWGLLADPRVAGRIGMDTDFTVVLGSMLKYKGHSLNSADPADVEDAVAALRELKLEQGLQQVVWDEMLDLLAEGELCVVQAFNGDTAVYMDEYEHISFFVPQEGSDFYLDVLAIPRDAPNKIGAEMFIDFMLRADVHAANNGFTGYAVPNRASIEGGHVREDLLRDPVRYPDITNLEPWRPFGTEMRNVWNKAWADFLMTGQA